MIGVHLNAGPFFQGTVANPPFILLVKRAVMNVPSHAELKKQAFRGFAGSWLHPTPALTAWAAKSLGAEGAGSDGKQS